MVRCLDNIFTDKYLIGLYEDVMSSPYTLSNVANRKSYPLRDGFDFGDCKIFGCTYYQRITKHFYNNNAPYRVMEAFEVLAETYLSELNFEIHSISANLQVMGQEGVIHKDEYIGDGSDRTLILFPHYKWEQDWGGSFQIFDDHDRVIEEYLPLPGRALFFDASVGHRGNPPIVPNVGRYSIAYRLRDLDA